MVNRRPRREKKGEKYLTKRDSRHDRCSNEQNSHARGNGGISQCIHDRFRRTLITTPANGRLQTTNANGTYKHHLQHRIHRHNKQARRTPHLHPSTPAPYLYTSPKPNQHNPLPQPGKKRPRQHRTRRHDPIHAHPKKKKTNSIQIYGCGTQGVGFRTGVWHRMDGWGTSYQDEEGKRDGRRGRRWKGG